MIIICPECRSAAPYDSVHKAFVCKNNKCGWQKKFKPEPTPEEKRMRILEEQHAAMYSFLHDVARIPVEPGPYEMEQGKLVVEAQDLIEKIDKGRSLTKEPTKPAPGEYQGLGIVICTGNPPY